MGYALLLVPDFLLIGGGALLRRMPAFPPAFWAGVERLVYYLLFPALLFRALASAAAPPGAGGALVGVVVAFTLGGIALSALGMALLRLDRATSAACFQCGFRFNTYIALAIAARIGGDSAIVLVGLCIAALVPIVNVAAVSAMAQGRGRQIVVELARNPLIVACVAGVGWRLAGWPLPDIVARVLAHLAGAALPLGLLAVGAGLRIEGAALPVRAVLWWNGVKLLGMPALAMAFAHLAGLPPLERALAVLMAAVPTAPSAYILASQMTGRGAPVALLISTGTLAAALTLPAWLALLAP